MNIEYYGYIYKVTDLRDGPRYGFHYVGKKKGKFQPWYFGSGKIIKAAVKKYGTDSFSVIPIAYVLSKEELNEQEKFWIKQNNCIWPKGYNIGFGGEGNPGFKQSKEAIEKGKKTRRATAEKRGYWETKETGEKRSKTLLAYRAEHPFQEERNEKIRQKKLLYKFTEEHKKNMSKPRGPMSEENKEIRCQSMIGKNVGKKYGPHTDPNCDCGWCKAKRGDYKGENNPAKSLESREKMRQVALGRKTIHNDVLNQEKHIKPELVQEYLNNGWVYGRLGSSIIKMMDTRSKPEWKQIHSANTTTAMYRPDVQVKLRKPKHQELGQKWPNLRRKCIKVQLSNQ